MAIAAQIAPTELENLVTDRYVGQYYEARLIYAPGTSYQPGITVDGTFLGFEVTGGTAGYRRQIIYYTAPDVGAYADDGVGMATKATVFAHDGSGTTLNFSHVALVKSTGNVKTFNANTVKPSAAVNGTYTNLPVTTSGSGYGLTVNVTITNSGAALGDYAVTVNKPGYNYAISDTIQITDAVLAAAGAITAGAGHLTTSVATINAPADAGDLLCVAETAGTVALTAGNEAAFYWDLKQYGFYTA